MSRNPSPASRARWNEKRKQARLESGMRPLLPPIGEDVASLFPHLVAEWSPQNSVPLTEVRPGSNRVMRWHCAAGHTWDTRVNHRTAGNGCIACRPRMDDETYRAHKRESFRKWYSDEGHGADKATKARERRYKEVVARHGVVCYLCNDTVPREDTHIDHVIPRSAGGPDSYANLRVTHSLCNLLKGRKLWKGPVWFGYFALGLASPGDTG